MPRATGAPKALDAYLGRHGMPGICGHRHARPGARIRDGGAQVGVLSTDPAQPGRGGADRARDRRPVSTVATSPPR